MNQLPLTCSTGERLEIELYNEKIFPTLEPLAVRVMPDTLRVHENRAPYTVPIDRATSVPSAKYSECHSKQKSDEPSDKRDYNVDEWNEQRRAEKLPDVPKENAVVRTLPRVLKNDNAK